MSELGRRQFLGWMGRAAGAVLLSPGCATGSVNRPNVLVLQPDQHRFSALGSSGDEQVKTPNLDRLASEGIRFSRAVSSSPTCAPFRASMQTGLHWHRHGVVGNGVRLDPGKVGFAELFAAAGYATGYIGKWHLDGKVDVPRGGFVPPERRHGWQVWDGSQKGYGQFTCVRMDESGAETPVPGCGWEPAWHTDMALEFIRAQRDGGLPWLYYVAYTPPHPPEECREDDLALYPPERIVLPPDLRMGPASLQERLRTLWRHYYALVSAVDREVGRILAGLRELGVEGNTIVVYVSDHGDLLGSHAEPGPGRRHDLRRKGLPYATAFRIPLIVRWPDAIRPGRVCDAFVGSADLAPTLLDLAGLRVPSSMDGISMAGWCVRGEGPRPEAAYLGRDGGRRWRAVWDGRHLYSVGRPSVLYDHEQDPHEIRNLLGDRSRAKLAKRMHDTLLRLAADTGDRGAAELVPRPT